MSAGWDDFRAVWVWDFEFQAPPGEKPDPVALVAHELKSGRTIRMFQDELRQLRQAPFDIGRDALCVGYFTTAEFGCHLELGWELPHHVLDLYVEFRAHTCGLRKPEGGYGLLGAQLWHRIEPITKEEKQRGRELVMRGGPWSAEERLEVLSYCESDVIGTARLFEAMRDSIDWPHARQRGREMKAMARIERQGTPLDAELYATTRDRWDRIRGSVIEQFDADYQVFASGKFNFKLFEDYLARSGIEDWPRAAKSGRLKSDDETFKKASESYPQLATLRRLRRTLAEMRSTKIAVGSDGRNRTLLSPFGARTGRSTPSASKYIWGPSSWMRGFVRPGPGRAFGYADYSQEEWAIAGIFSRDDRMVQLYEAGDPYLAFAKLAGMAPQDATRKTHPEARELGKTCIHGMNYGMSEIGLARRTGSSVLQSGMWIKSYRREFRKYVAWREAVVEDATWNRKIVSAMGWPQHLELPINPRSIGNYPMQSGGADILRLACCFATEKGAPVCATIHDALAFECDERDLEDVTDVVTKAMVAASRVVLRGFELRVDTKVVRYPDRYADGRGAAMWDTVMNALQRVN